MKYEQKYKLSYDLRYEAGEFTAADLEKSNQCGTDALICFSVIYPPDGSLSVHHFSFDGRNEGKPVEDNEVFKIWMMLGMRLAKSTQLDHQKRMLAKAPAEMFFGRELPGGCGDPNCEACDIEKQESH